MLRNIEKESLQDEQNVSKWQYNSLITSHVIYIAEGMIGMRMNAFNDTGLGEPEQDANTALIELDKGTFIFSFI